jgi:hypothetical protein
VSSRQYAPAAPRTTPVEGPAAPMPSPDESAYTPSSSGSATPWLDAAAGEVDAAGRKAKPFEGAPKRYEDALELHTRAVDLVRGVVTNALSGHVSPNDRLDSPTLLARNAAQWLVEGGPVSLVVLTQVHDAHLRPGLDGRGYFDTRAGLWDRGDYDPTLVDGAARNDAGIASSDSDGATRNGQITLRDPHTTDRSTLLATLVHEVQHVADHNLEDQQDRPEGSDPVTTAAPWMYSRYQSEFRSYWPQVRALESEPAVQRPVTVWTPDGERTARTGFENARQQAVFDALDHQPQDHVYRTADGEWCGAYGHLVYYYAVDADYRAMVDAYVFPTGENLVLSLRIEALTRALERGAPLEAPVGALDGPDRKFLRESRHSSAAPFWELAERSLDPERLAWLERALAE